MILKSNTLDLKLIVVHFQNEKPIEDAPTTDRLSGEAFIIEKMGLHVLGDYMKFPEEKGDKKLIIE